MINTARGELLDTNALPNFLKVVIWLLQPWIQSTVFSDFTNKLRDHPLIDYAKNHPNLLITPHIGGSTIDAWTATEDLLSKKLQKH